MADSFFARRVLGTLKPIDTMGEEIVAKIGMSELVRVDVVRPRNAKFLRKFFALLNVVFPHQETYPTMKKFRGAVEAALGFCETFKTLDGRLVVMPDSISFANMSEDDFAALFERTVLLITTKIVPGLERDDLLREVEDILRGRE